MKRAEVWMEAWKTVVVRRNPVLLLSDSTQQLKSFCGLGMGRKFEKEGWRAQEKEMDLCKKEVMLCDREKKISQSEEKLKRIEGQLEQMEKFEKMEREEKARERR